jgi:hypothetical protein
MVRPPKHKVMYEIPEREQGTSDIVFSVTEEGKALGKLRVSKGWIVWVPRQGQYGYGVRSPDLAEFAKGKGKRHLPVR